MDILRKMFKMTEEANGKEPENAFRKPQWFEEAETDDELFDDDRKYAFQVFTNPMELQKHFEQRMQTLLEALSEFEDSNVKVEKDPKRDFLKPGFEGSILKEFEKHAKTFVDTDLDGEIYADQLHTLMQRLNPSEEMPNILPRNDKTNRVTKKRLSDEETILGKIHGTIVDEELHRSIPRTRPEIMTPMTPMLPRNVTPFGGAFEGTYQGPKMFSQSIVSKTVRKPDGTYETTKITKDSEGNTVTTTTRTINGKSETVTTYDNAVSGSSIIKQEQDMFNKTKLDEPEIQVFSDRNIAVTKEGYAVPRNLW